MTYLTIIISILASLSLAQASFEPLHSLEATQKLKEGVQLGSLKNVHEAIAQGAEINDADPFGKTPLHYAVLKGNPKILQALLEAGANPNKADNQETTPLHLASRNCNHRAVKRLIQAGADVNHQDHVGQTPLHAAAEQGCGNTLVRNAQENLH